jgi:hypothetical protein
MAFVSKRETHELIFDFTELAGFEGSAQPSHQHLVEREAL